MSGQFGYGIDIGGSGIKGAKVDLETGALASERVRVDTPPESTPDGVAAIVAKIVTDSGWEGPYGCTFPGIVKDGVIHSAKNLGDQWLHTDFRALLTKVSNVPVQVLNDADAAGLAEMRFGAAKGRDGVVLVTTLGTGIGSALFYNGVLVPNTELGHLEMGGKSAEKRAAASIKDLKGWSYPEWAVKLQDYYAHVEFLFSPDLIVVGGGVSKKSEKFLPLLKLNCEIVPAQLFNEAGIVGAAMAAAELAAEQTLAH